MSFKKVLGHVIPIAASVATSGVLGGGVAKQVSSILKLGKNPTEQDVEKALATANPEQYVALHKLEADTKRQAIEADLKMEELDVEREKVHQLDRDSARKRQVATGDKTPTVLAYIVTGSTFALTAWLIAHGPPEDAAAATIVGALYGYAWSSVQTVLTFYFGSSKGSKDKTEAMAKAASK